MRVSVTIPTFRRHDRVMALIDVLRNGVRAPDEIVVVDNDPIASEELESGCVERGARYIRIGRGLDLAGARNTGWRFSNSDLCVFIDDDNVVDGGVVAAFVDAADRHPESGLIAPIIYHGALDAKIWCAGVRRSMRTTRTMLLAPADATRRESWHTDDAPGAFAIRRSVLEHVGGFDEERFPFHYDEGDLCERIRALGFATTLVSSVRLAHSVEPVSGPGEEMVRSFRLSGAHRVAVTVRSRVFFHRRYSRGFDRLLALGIFIPAYVVMAVADSLRAAAGWREGFATMRAVLAGAVEGYTA